MTSTEPTGLTPEPDARPGEPRRRYRKALYWSSVAAVGALIAAAHFVPTLFPGALADADEHVGYAVTSFGIAGNAVQAGSDFNLELSRTGAANTWDDHTRSAPLDVTYDDALEPGSGTVLARYHVRNASDMYASTLNLTMHEHAAETNAVLRDSLRFTVTVGDQRLAEDTFDELASGVQLNNLGPGDVRTVTVSAYVPDGAGDDALAYGRAHLLIELSGHSLVIPDA